MSLQNKKILLVDDDNLLILLYKDALINEGAEVISAANGREGLQKLKENENTDLIIVDVMMPEMGGYGMLKKIKEDPKTKNIPVIVLTNLDSSNQEITDIKKLGPAGYFVKTETPIKEMIKKLENYLKNGSVPTAAAN